MKLRSDPFLFIFFSWGGGGWGGGKFRQSVPLFPTASLFPEEEEALKIQSLLSLLSQALYIQTSSFLCAGLIFCSSCYYLDGGTA